MRIINYLNSYKKKNFFIVKKKGISSLDKWIYDKNYIYHISKKFFQIHGFRINSNFYKKKKLGPTINRSKRVRNSRNNKNKKK